MSILKKWNTAIIADFSGKIVYQTESNIFNTKSIQWSNFYVTLQIAYTSQLQNFTTFTPHPFVYDEE